MCAGSLQAPEEARPVPGCEHLCPSVLVWPKYRQERRGGKNKAAEDILVQERSSALLLKALAPKVDLSFSDCHCLLQGDSGRT